MAVVYKQLERWASYDVIKNHMIFTEVKYQNSSKVINASNL